MTVKTFPDGSSVDMDALQSRQAADRNFYRSATPWQLADRAGRQDKLGNKWQAFWARWKLRKAVSGGRRDRMGVDSYDRSVLNLLETVTFGLVKAPPTVTLASRKGITGNTSVTQSDGSVVTRKRDGSVSVRVPANASYPTVSPGVGWVFDTIDRTLGFEGPDPVSEVTGETGQGPGMLEVVTDAASRNPGGFLISALGVMLLLKGID